MQNKSYSNIITQTQTTINPVAIYCRVSTENQEAEGTSLDTQRQRCVEYCQSHGYTVTHQLIETYSGLSLERPKLDELRQRIRNEEITGLVVYSLDRFSRDPTHGVILQEELEKHGVFLEAVTETVESTDLGKLISYIRGFAAKLEAEKLRERTVRGIKARVFDKKLPVTYRTPYGYQWDRTGKRPKLVPNGDYYTAKLIITLSLEGKSYDYIIAELKRRGILSPAGLPEWNKHTISSIIRNPVYAGQYYAFKSEVKTPKKRNGHTKRVKSSVKRLAQDQWHHIPEIEIVNPPMTLEQRALLLDQIEQRQRLSSRNANREYLLRGMIFCDTHKGKNGAPRVYHGRPKRDTYYYSCPVGGCKHPNIPGPYIEARLQQEIRTFIMVNAKKLVSSEDTKATRESLEKSLAESQNQYERNINALASLEAKQLAGEISIPEVYERTRSNLEARCNYSKKQQDSLLAQIAQLKHTENVTNDLKQFLFSVADKLISMTDKDWREIYEKLDLHIITNGELWIGVPTDAVNILTLNSIASPAPCNGLSYQQYYPIRFSLSDFNIDDLLGSKGVKHG